MYEGSSERIQRVIANITDTGASFKDAYDGSNGVHRLTLGKRTFELREERAFLHHGTGDPNRRLNKGPEPGLYNERFLDYRLRGYGLDDRMTENDDGVLTVETRVTNAKLAREGGRQLVLRRFSPADRTLFMNLAFLENVPRWMKTPGPGMDPIDGTPTITALTLRQMLMMNVPDGGLDSVRMTGIQNIRAIIELHALVAENMNIHEAAARTHSVRYAEGAIVQSGHRIDHVKWLEGSGEGLRVRLGELMEKEEKWGRADGTPDPQLVAYHDELIAKFGRGKVTRDSMVLDGYDLDLLLSPFDMKTRFN
jgi:hypothetical protein